MTPPGPGAPLPPRGALRRAREEMQAGFSEMLGHGGLADPARPMPAEAAAADADPQRRLGRYLLVEKIGRGAMASVWKSWDRELGRWVAVKVLQDSEAGTLRARFLREAQATAGLRHPHLVTIFDAGEHGGRLFLVMELVRGKPFDVTAPRDEAVASLRKVALGLDEAHRQGVIHRDIKPGNIMMDERGEPRVVDFGLAHLVHDVQERLTRTGATIGTPIYMAPEQVGGRIDSISAATDVYALGVILYEILAGRPPHAGGSATEVYGRILSDDPVAPSKLNAHAPRDLETIALKALDKEPARRYPTAAAFAEDLRRYLAGEPVLARRSWVLQRWRRWIVRRRRATAVVAVLLVALGVSSGVLLSRLSSARRTLDLWTRISSLLPEAERFARAGEMEPARNRLDEGVAICRNFIKQEELPEARYFLGRFLRARGRIDEAETELTLAINGDPGLSEARLERGLLRIERYRAALWRHRVDPADVRPGSELPLEDVERRHPGLQRLREAAIDDLSALGGRTSYFREIDADYGKAVLKIQLGELDAAEGLLNGVLRKDPLYSRALLSLGELADRRGDFQGLIRFLTQCIAQHQGLVDVYLSRGAATFLRAQRSLRSPEAKDWLKSTVEDATSALKVGDGAFTVEALLLRAAAQVDLGTTEAALADLDRALPLAAESFDVIARRGQVRGMRGEHAAAIEDDNRALAIHPGHPFVLNNRGLSRVMTGDVEGALADYTEAIKVDPGNANPWHNRGNLWKNRKEDLEKAFADYSEAIRLKPGFPEALFSRADIHGRRGDAKAAIQDLDDAITSDMHFVKAYVNRGTFHRKRFLDLGQAGEAAVERAAAIRDYEKALELGMTDLALKAKVEAALESLRQEY